MLLHSTDHNYTSLSSVGASFFSGVFNGAIFANMSKYMLPYFHLVATAKKNVGICICLDKNHLIWLYQICNKIG